MGEATDRLLSKLTRIPVIGYERVSDGNVEHVDAHFREMDLRNPLRGQNYISSIENHVPGLRANHPRVLSPLIHARTVDALMEQSSLLRGTDLGTAFAHLADVLDSNNPTTIRSVADGFVRIARGSGRGDLARWANIAHRIADQLEGGKSKLSREEFDSEIVQLTASLQSGYEPGSAVERLHVDLASRNFSKGSRDKMADSGSAMPDGSFPIPDVDALKRAIKLAGNAKDPAAAKAHIRKRAKALGAENLIPEDW